jgi:hypothetical protein
VISFFFHFLVRLHKKKTRYCNLNLGVCRLQQEFNSGTKGLTYMQQFSSVPVSENFSLRNSKKFMTKQIFHPCNTLSISKSLILSFQLSNLLPIHTAEITLSSYRLISKVISTVNSTMQFHGTSLYNSIHIFLLQCSAVSPHCLASHFH